MESRHRLEQDRAGHMGGLGWRSRRSGVGRMWAQILSQYYNKGCMVCSERGGLFVQGPIEVIPGGRFLSIGVRLSVRGAYLGLG